MRPNSLRMSFRYVRDGPFGFFSEDANIDLSSPAICTGAGAHPLDPRCAGTAFNKDVVGQLNGNLLYHVTNHLLFFFSSSYDVREARFPGVRGAFKILSQCECWTATVSLKKNTNPAKTSFGFDFNLLELKKKRR